MSSIRGVWLAVPPFARQEVFVRFEGGGTAENGSLASLGSLTELGEDVRCGFSYPPGGHPRQARGWGLLHAK
jgi:hypothetical protein